MGRPIRGHGLPAELAGTKRTVAALERASRVDSSSASILYTPARPDAAFNTNGQVEVTSGSFVTIYTGGVEIVQHIALAAWVTWITDGSTTGEIRLYTIAGATDAVALGAGTSGAARFRWLHPGTMDSGPLYVRVQARRVSGSGTVYVYGPDLGYQWYNDTDLLYPAPTTGGAP